MRLKTKRLTLGLSSLLLFSSLLNVAFAVYITYLLNHPVTPVVATDKSSDITLDEALGVDLMQRTTFKEDGTPYHWGDLSKKAKKEGDRHDAH